MLPCDDLIEVPVEQLSEGDLIDLEGDAYADPAHDNSWLYCEYVEVSAVVEDTYSTTVYCESIDVVFPHGHMVKKMKNYNHRLTLGGI